MASLASPGRGDSNWRLRSWCEGALGVAILALPEGQFAQVDARQGQDPAARTAQSESLSGEAFVAGSPDSPAGDPSRSVVVSEDAFESVELPTTLDPGKAPPHHTRFFFGGGQLNEAGLREFWRCAGGEQSKILVIAWGSTVPDENYERFRAALQAAITNSAAPLGLAAENYSLHIEKMPDLVDRWSAADVGSTPNQGDDFEWVRSRLREATAVFILGGDQVLLMERLIGSGTDTVLKELLYDKRIVLAGTSAGTAIASHTMIGGEDPPPSALMNRSFTRSRYSLQNDRGEEVSRPFFIGAGLGVIPRNVIVEQHLLRTGRFERLKAAVEATPEVTWGIGITDSTGLVWNGHGRLTVTGPGIVKIVRKNGSGVAELVASLAEGEGFDLAE